MKFVVTIDTEEDDWARYSPTVNSVNNIQRIALLQEMFDDLLVRPTYLVTYPVATDPSSVALLKNILDAGKCEIGMHCHPWNTPPLSPAGTPTDGQLSMLCNLPENVQTAKLTHLAETIERSFGRRPVSFRAGRWGFDQGTARCLPAVGVSVDSSITPYTDWRSYGGPDHSNHGPQPVRYRPAPAGSACAGTIITSVPASIAYLQSHFRARHRLERRLEGWVSRKLRLKGVLDRLGLLSKVWLSPEVSSVDQMIGLIDRMETESFPCLNLTFHSPTLQGGLTPFVGIGCEEGFFRKVHRVLEFARSRGHEFMTLSQFAEEHAALAPVHPGEWWPADPVSREVR